MPVLEAVIERLPRARLRGAAYERFARETFSQTPFEAHVAHCRWLYQQNPAAADGDALPIYVCRDDDAIVGQIAIIPVRIVLDGVNLRSGWCTDFFVLPSHQRRGLGRQLLSAAHADFPLLMSLGQTQASRNLFLRCGWHHAGVTHTYKRFLRPMRCLTKKALESISHAPPAGAPQTCAPTSAAPAPQFDEVDRDLSLGRYAASELRGRDAPGTRIRRGVDFLRWRYANPAAPAYSILRYPHENSTPAFAVWRTIRDPRWRRGNLVDLIYPSDLPDAGLAELLAMVTDAMRADDVDIFECQTSDQRVLDALPHGPFATRQPGVHFVYGGIDGTRWPLINADQWRLYAGDCDVDALHARGSSQ